VISYTKKFYVTRMFYCDILCNHASKFFFFQPCNTLFVNTSSIFLFINLCEIVHFKPYCCLQITSTIVTTKVKIPIACNEGPNNKMNSLKNQALINEWSILHQIFSAKKFPLTLLIIHACNSTRRTLFKKS
jgi:hypothetical protein